MPKTISDTTSTRRRSARPTTKTKKAAETVAAVEDKDDEVKMPEGYNPSDDSEDEYVPPTRTKKVNLVSRLKRRKEDDSDSESDAKEATPAKKARGKKTSTSSTPSRPTSKTPSTATPTRAASKTTSNTTPSRTASKSASTTTPSRAASTSTTGRAGSTATPSRGASSATPSRAASTTTPSRAGSKTSKGVKSETVEVKKETSQTSGMIDSNTCYCPFVSASCKEKLKIDGNARFHISLHYYDINKFSEEDILVPTDADANGKAVDEKGSKIKYTCRYPGCTKRKMGYKEMCVHLGTQHQLLKQLMMKDPTPEIKVIAKVLYPDVEIESPVKVKQEATDVPQEPLENGNSEDEDNPDDPPPASKKTPARKAPAPRVIKTPLLSKPMEALKIARPRVDKIMNCLLCKAKDGKNLNSRTSELKYHMSVCAYGIGGFIPLLAHHQPGKEDVEKVTDLEEYGARYKYKCPFENCDKNSGKQKSIGYKEFSIHAGVMHGLLERWAETAGLEGAKELYELLKSLREEDNIELPEIPPISAEELHICLICDGADKEGKNLSFGKDKIYQTRYHYSVCLYDTGLYVSMYPPGKQNSTEDGQPRDILGREVKYSCQEKGCTLRRKMGYKEFVIHMANDHGGLDEILKNHADPKVQDMAPKLVYKRK